MFFGCDEKKESATFGELYAVADEGIFKLITQTADSFMTAYTNSKISIKPVTGREAITKILNGETELAVVCRELNLEEKEFIKKNNIEVQLLKYCLDGIILIVNSQEAYTTIEYQEIKRLLTGESKLLQPLIPGKNSSVNEYLRQKFFAGSEIPAGEIINSESEIISRVNGSKGLVGFVSAGALINDSSSVKPLFLGPEIQSGVRDTYYEPHPGYYVQNLYPLTRTVYILVRELNMGLAKGFATYLTSNKGQEIVLQQKLAPGAVPVRLVQETGLMKSEQRNTNLC